jgi:hypothetical protein
MKLRDSSMNKKTIEIPLYLNRINFFAGRTLTAVDLKTEQDYFRERMRQHNLNCHGVGIVSGLEVSISISKGPTKSIIVAPGTALDALGNEITLSSTVRCAPPINCKVALLVLSWAEREIESVPALTNEGETGLPMASRVEEYATLQYEPVGDRTHRPVGVVLARLMKLKRSWRVDEEFLLQRAGV